MALLAKMVPDHRSITFHFSVGTIFQLLLMRYIVWHLVAKGTFY